MNATARSTPQFSSPQQLAGVQFSTPFKLLRDDVHVLALVQHRVTLQAQSAPTRHVVVINVKPGASLHLGEVVEMPSTTHVELLGLAQPAQYFRL